jgi:hypothetical protein
MRAPEAWGVGLGDLSLMKRADMGPAPPWMSGEGWLDDGGVGGGVGGGARGRG